MLLYFVFDFIFLFPIPTPLSCTTPCVKTIIIITLVEEMVDLLFECTKYTYIND